MLIKENYTTSDTLIINLDLSHGYVIMNDNIGPRPRGSE